MNLLQKDKTIVKNVIWMNWRRNDETELASQCFRSQNWKNHGEVTQITLVTKLDGGVTSTMKFQYTLQSWFLVRAKLAKMNGCSILCLAAFRYSPQYFWNNMFEYNVEWMQIILLNVWMQRQRAIPYELGECWRLNNGNVACHIFRNVFRTWIELLDLNQQSTLSTLMTLVWIYVVTVDRI